MLNIGSKLGPYTVAARIGAGGMGVVYRAHDDRLERDVAIKVLPPGLLTDEPARRRFRKEALALAKLSHPNIAAVYDVGEQDGVDYLVMECVPGQSLAEKLKSGPLPVREAVSFGAQIAAALEEAHEHGVVHRDLKPSNIMVTPKGHAKVLDFGLAKLFGPTDPPDATLSAAETKGPVGTLLYMSPEQAEGKMVDSRTDLWSLGVVLFESLAGTSPFQGAGGGLSLLRAITRENPKPLREFRRDIPPQVSSMVSHALEKDVSKRYQSASEISRDSSAILAELSAPALPPAARSPGFAPRYVAPAALLILLFAAAAAWLYWRSEKRHWAREEAIPQIAKLKAEEKSLAAFLLLEEAERYLPGNPQIAQLAAEDATTISINSSPGGATVEIQDYLLPNGPWHRLGATPLKNVRIPTGYFRWKVSKRGVGEYITAPETQNTMNFPLDLALASPEGMVRVDGGKWAAFIDFIGWLGPYDLPPYYLDRFEVTNRQYQQFVDSGGYEKRSYWTEKFMQNGRELGWEEAMALFRDGTGRYGPSTWEGGHFPEGQAEFPVSGVSWYEASAYAAFASKSLPALAQWYQAAPQEVARYTVRASNISRSALAPVGAFKGLGPFGNYDMAGNVKEWVVNTVGDNLHLILGGGWKSQTYLYAEPEALPPFDRSPANGFRCVRNVAPLPAEAASAIKRFFRDFSAVKPASDEVFRAYTAMYYYDKKPLNAQSEGVVQDTPDWRKEKVAFNAAYGNERVIAYLFLPKNVRPPYQTIVFFPSAGVLSIPDSRDLGDIQFFDYVVQSGRAVLYPIYKGTYERQDKFELPSAGRGIEDSSRRFQDVARSFDYLDTRPDIDKDKLAYLGVSMGSAEGVIYTALLQDRLKTVVFLDGGFFLDPPSPGADQADFAPRLKKPVLMVNGRYDFSFSLDKAQNPLFRMLGSPESDKRHVILETPHDVTAQRPELVKTVLDWLDKYLGRVN
jgi:eukaryotic-like serine/threonine-protein kinase